MTFCFKAFQFEVRLDTGHLESDPLEFISALLTRLEERMLHCKIVLS